LPLTGRCSSGDTGRTRPREKSIKSKRCSKVVAADLKNWAEMQKAAEMAEGYQAMADEQRQFTAMAFRIALEVLPEWK
jgi:hypothetical protein